jgi:ABC-type nitrate/sulfonate/bicarbonate transport system permease component
MDANPQNHEKLLSEVMRMNSKFLALAMGLIAGLFLFLATNWLLIKGGHVSPSGEYVVGPHLQLLSQIFIGYRVSFLGSIIGFFYGFAVGTLAGSAVGLLYNKIVDIRN